MSDEVKVRTTIRSFADLCDHDPASAALLMWQALMHNGGSIEVTPDEMDIFDGVNIGQLVTIEASFTDDSGEYTKLTIRANPPTTS